MARKSARPRGQADAPARVRRRGGLFTGLFFGLVAGLVVAAALAWYFNRQTGGFRVPASAQRVEPVTPPTVTPLPDRAPAPPAPPQAQPSPPARPSPPPAPREAQAPTAQAPARATEARPPATVEQPAPRAARQLPPNPVPQRPADVDYSFYRILPGEQPGKPAVPPEKPPPAPRPSDHWWLQVAALKNQAEAERLKAQLTLLGLRVITQRIETGGMTLHRVRVGPYAREEDAFGDLDTLAANDYEPRLLKDPNPP
jgi:hypothetical protein